MFTWLIYLEAAVISFPCLPPLARAVIDEAQIGFVVTPGSPMPSPFNFYLFIFLMVSL